MGKNDFIIEYIGLSEWHRAGYTGKNSLCATGERRVPIGKMKDFCYCPFGDEIGDDHAYKTAMVFHSFAPGAKLYMVWPDDAHDGNFTKKTLGFLKENDVTNMFVSLRADDCSGLDEGLKQVPNLKYWSSNGNYGDEGYNRRAECEFVYGVGAYDVKEQAPAGYSSVSEYVDFVAPGNVYFEATNGSEILTKGTSFSAPVLCAMSACVDDFFIQNTGRSLTRMEMYQFMKDCCRDIEVPGKDTKTGWGLPILPKPEDVEVSKYVEDEKMTFDDENKINPAHKADVEWAVDRGLIIGDTNGCFNPKDSVTREQLCTILHRLESR